MESETKEGLNKCFAVYSLNGSLSISAPNVSSDSDYYFYVDSLVDTYTNPVHKVIKLTVKNCIAQNCKKCSSVDISSCTVCESGYNLNLGVCTTSNDNSASTSNSKMKEISQVANALKLASQLMCLIITITVIFASFNNTSSIAVIWLMINQLQIYFLLLLTRAFIPDDVKTCIIGLDFVLNPYGYIAFSKIFLYDTVMKNFKFDLSNSLLEQLKLRSDSTIYNLSSFFCVIILAAVFHVFICIISVIVSKMSSEGKCSRIKILVKWITNKTLHILTFGYYKTIVITKNIS